MTWLTGQGAADSITHDEWNEMATCIINISSNAIYFSSNAKSLFAGSSNVKSRFPGSSTAISRYRQSSSAGANHWNYVSSQAISGQWRTPLYPSLTAAGAATVSNIGKIIMTSGNSYGTWVWISVFGGSTYQWMQLTYLSGV